MTRAAANLVFPLSLSFFSATLRSAGEGWWKTWSEAAADSLYAKAVLGRKIVSLLKPLLPIFLSRHARLLTLRPITTIRLVAA